MTRKPCWIIFEKHPPVSQLCVKRSIVSERRADSGSLSLIARQTSPHRAGGIARAELCEGRAAAEWIGEGVIDANIRDCVLLAS